MGTLKSCYWSVRCRIRRMCSDRSDTRYLEFSTLQPGQSGEVDCSAGINTTPGRARHKIATTARITVAKQNSTISISTSSNHETHCVHLYGRSGLVLARHRARSIRSRRKFAPLCKHAHSVPFLTLSLQKCGFDQLCHLWLDDGTPYWFQCDPAAQCTCNGCGGCTLSNINNGFANCE